MEAFVDTLPIVCNGFNRMAIIEGGTLRDSKDYAKDTRDLRLRDVA